MVVTVNCGHMTSVTTEATRPPNPPVPPASTPAQSEKTKLIYGYPASPLIGAVGVTDDSGTYTPDAVVSLRPKMLRNLIRDEDRGAAEGYWGYDTVESSPESPSGVDLMYGGAPDFHGIVLLKDSPAAIIASPYMPNLAVPSNFFPIADNPTPVVIGIGEMGTETVVSLPPGQGIGHATNPSVTSNLIKNMTEVIVFEDGMVGDKVSPPLVTPVTHPLPV